MAHWKRLGRIFTAADGPDWMASHASVPVAVPIPNSSNAVRIYFTPRDSKNKSQIAWLDCALNGSPHVLAIADKPLLEVGVRGTFDDCGTMTSWVTHNASVSHHYYIGWNVRNTVPFHNSIGLATVKEAENIGEAPIVETRLTGPVLDRSQQDPFFCSNPCVLRNDDHWMMWYISGTEWLEGDKGAAASYVIKKAESIDGRNWTVGSDVALELSDRNEIAHARPCVLRDETGWHMWFCYRGKQTPYRIGYAYSDDGTTWARNDSARGLDPIGSTWESDMVCYPFVFRHGKDLFMLYCGNGYSHAGFGIAVWAEE